MGRGTGAKQQCEIYPHLPPNGRRNALLTSSHTVRRGMGDALVLDDLQRKTRRHAVTRHPYNDAYGTRPYHIPASLFKRHDVISLSVFQMNLCDSNS